MSSNSAPSSAQGDRVAGEVVMGNAMEGENNTSAAAAGSGSSSGRSSSSSSSSSEEEEEDESSSYYSTTTGLARSPQQQQQQQPRSSYSNASRTKKQRLEPSPESKHTQNTNETNIHKLQSNPANAHTTSKPSTNSSPPSTIKSTLSPPRREPPHGWRVKLYKLNNSNGTWDDCGTGRISLLVFPSHDQQHNTPHKPSDNNANIENQLFQELGSPMLSMHAEDTMPDVKTNNTGPTDNAHTNKSMQPTNHSSKTTTLPTHHQQRQHKRLLLHTRIMLRDCYQKQNDNIITWCEPSFRTNYDHVNDTSPPTTLDDATHTGRPHAHDTVEDNGQEVDLALSFQDNTGCLDIWNKITSYKSRAVEMLRAKVANVSRSSESNKIIAKPANPPTNDGNRSGENSPNSSRNIQPQQQHSAWNKVNSDLTPNHQHSHLHHEADGNEFGDANKTPVTAAPMPYRSNGAPNQPTTNSEPMPDHQNQQHAQQQPSTDVTTNLQLPNPPTLASLERIADTIAAAQTQMQQRENIALFISQSDCAYLKYMLSLFPPAEAKDDYNALATLAVCMKTILLLNDPGIIETIVSDGAVFEGVCSVLEYDPDLRDKANHRWFIRERAKFRTVVLMEDEDLMSAIHRSFRATYLRDTLLRPTMDEGSLSTLASLLTFTHTHVVNGVMRGSHPTNEEAENQIKSEANNGQPQTEGNKSEHQSYLARIIRVLGREVKTIRDLEWEEMENRLEGDDIRLPAKTQSHRSLSITTAIPFSPSAELPSTVSKEPSIWRQHLAPQDPSISSRKIRRRGCLSFLRELFNMVRTSLQQSNKDDFYAMIALMDVDLTENDGGRVREKNSKQEQPASKNGETNTDQPSDGVGICGNDESENTMRYDTLNFLGLLGSIVSDPRAEAFERSAGLEILSSVAMHDPSLIRRHCLDEQATTKENNEKSGREGIPQRPEPNERRQVLFTCPPNDLLRALLYVMAIETDAGILLQTTEILKILLDTEMMGEHGQLGGLGCVDNEEEPPPGSSALNGSLVGPAGSATSADGASEQNTFLKLFYDFYVQWLVAPFQYVIMATRIALPFSLAETHLISLPSLRRKTNSPLLDRFGTMNDLFYAVPLCAIRTSFAVEVLTFCVRAHCYRMKFFVLTSRLLASVLKLLSPKSSSSVPSGDRCLKLSSLRFLRSVLSIKDEFYHRHIVQHNLFAPVFEAFRANPVGDNLVSSAIIEMCNFVRTENIKSLLAYIVTRHLSLKSSVPMSATSEESGDGPGSSSHGLSLEDVATPYVDTLTQLRKKYEDNLKATKGVDNNIVSTRSGVGGSHDDSDGENGGPKSFSNYFGNSPSRGGRVPRIGMSDKAIEDQRKFRETDEEESYFNDDDEEEDRQSPGRPESPSAGDKISGAPEDEDLQRAPHFLSLNGGEESESLDCLVSDPPSGKVE